LSLSALAKLNQKLWNASFPLPANVPVFVVILELVIWDHMRREETGNLDLVGRAPASGSKPLLEQDQGRSEQDLPECMKLGREILAKVSNIDDSVAIIARELYKHIEKAKRGALAVVWRKSLQWLKRLF